MLLTSGFSFSGAFFYQSPNNHRLMNNYKASFLLPCNSKKGRASFWNIMIEKTKESFDCQVTDVPSPLKSFPIYLQIIVFLMQIKH